MELNLEASGSPVRDAATVVLLRDGQDGLEVFMVKRHRLSDVLGGAYVFPGGKVDAEDARADLQQRIDASTDILRDALGEPELDTTAAVALHIAAMREAFEETGVLFSPGADDALAQEAWALLRTGRAFDEVLDALDLPLQASVIHPWSRWITPQVGGVIRKRFDTRFFIARMPTGQHARHDNHEATESEWLAPRDALRRYWDREIELAPPQIMSLAHLARHANVDSALHEARSRRPPLIHPEPIEEGGVRMVCYPGDARHSVTARALPGPTRLRYAEKRFEPLGGLDALFADIP